MSRTGISTTLGLLMAVTLAGCSGRPTGGTAEQTEAPSSSALQPRPAVLVLDGVDPCSLLTDAQRSRLGVNRGKPGDNIEDPDRPACDWSNFPNVPDNGWVARIVMRYGAEHALGSQTGSQQVSVGGFPAVQTSAASLDPKENCLLFLDVAPGQTLEASYQNVQGDYPGINHEVACQQAEKAAALMLDTLKSLKG